jgi:hypothetical protein
LNIKSETKGDSLFSTVNELPSSKENTAEKTITSQMDRVNRYNLSKSLISEADHLERKWIINFTDTILKKVNRYRNNYIFKGVLLTGFLLTAIKGIFFILKILGREFYWEMTISKDPHKSFEKSLKSFQKSIYFLTLFGASCFYL